MERQESEEDQIAKDQGEDFYLWFDEKRKVLELGGDIPILARLKMVRFGATKEEATSGIVIN